MFKMSNKILIFLSYLDFVIAGLLMHISQDVKNNNVSFGYMRIWFGWYKFKL